jgi:peroxiredoxin
VSRRASDAACALRSIGAVAASDAACYGSRKDLCREKRNVPSNDTMAGRLAEESRRAERDEPSVTRAYDNLVERLSAAGAGKDAPKKNDLLPAFVLPDERGQITKLADLTRSGPVVVSLNRGHWCSYCRIELEGLQGIHDEIRKRGGSIVAITPDRQHYARKLKERSRLNFPVLSDIDNAYAMSLSLVVWCGVEIRTLYKASHLDLAESQGNEGWLIPIPATFVVGTDQRIKARFVDVDFRKRMPPNEILSAL